MKIQTTRGRLLASTMIAGAVAVAAPVLAVTALSALMPSVAAAQDYSAGSLLGVVKDDDGVPVAGATVTVKSLDQGFVRDLTTDDQGQFRVPLVPIGGYSVAIKKSGYRETTDKNVRVGLGGSSAYSFTLASTDSAVSELVVTATANPQLDFAATTKGLTVDIESLTKESPIGRSVAAITQLAPGVVAGSSSRVSTAPSAANFGGQPSIGGGSVAENAFYINGLNITNFDTYVGAAEVPFDFYKSVEVKTSGYSAEFGRATGGIVNAVTKSGSNTFKFGVHGNYELDGLRSTSPDSYIIANHRAIQKQNSNTFEVSGPILPDHLFFYALAQVRDYEVTQAQKTLRQIVTDKTDDPFYGAKLDAYLTSKQRLELTYFDTSKTINRTARAYTASTDTVGAVLPGTKYNQGGENWVARYTGTFTDWFTLSAAYGINKDSNGVSPTNTVDPLVQEDYSTGSLTTISSQKSGTIERRTTERKFYRVDGDFYFNLLGDHHVRAGYDHEDTTLDHASVDTGPGLTGVAYIYHQGSTGDTFNVPAGVNYVEVSTNRLGGAAVTGTNEAFYIQDAWDLTPDLSLQIGLRNDKFTLGNLRGEQVLNLKNNWGPRVGVTWDPGHEGKDKIYGNYGRYFIPPASNLSYRGADLGYSTFFYAPGYVVGSGSTVPNFTPNATTQAPTALGTQITTSTQAALPAGTLTTCPANNIVAGTASVVGCTVSFGLGIAEPAYSKTSQNLKATYEDEFVIGYEHKFSPLLKAGLAFTYRTLKRVSEDTTLDPFIVSYCNATQTASVAAACATVYNNSWQYIVFNPGEDLTINLRQPDPLVHTAGDIATLAALPKTVTFTAAQLGFPKPERTYKGLEVTFERAFDGKWGLRGSYTLSKSEGNYEGTVLSDNNQADAGSTILYDFIGLTDNQYGLLPNHHAHQFKLFGSYAVTDNFTVGFNATVISPKHQGCLGVHPTDGNSAGYGSSSRYCQNFAAAAAAGTTPYSVPVQRGSALETDWTKTLDISLRYTVPADLITVGTFVLRADIFNVFDEDGITSREERGETNGGGRRSQYGLPIAYQEPRYVRLGFDLNF